MTPRTIGLMTKNGPIEFTTILTPDRAAEILWDGHLAGDLDSFEADLLRSYRGNPSRMSDKQRSWMLYKAQARVAPLPTVKTPVRTTGIDLGPILNVLTQLGEHVKHPSLRLKTADGRDVVLKVAGQRSKFPGSINVTDGKPFNENVWYGRIDLDGSTTVKDQGVLDLFGRLAQDPAGVAAEIGHATGSCIVCGKPLTNTAQGSARTGYGNICAVRIGWPWAPNGKDWAQRHGAGVRLDGQDELEPEAVLVEHDQWGPYRVDDYNPDQDRD